MVLLVLGVCSIFSVFLMDVRLLVEINIVVG